MDDDKKEATARLEFFESAVLAPAMIYPSWCKTPEDRVASDYCAVETAYWASLGAQINYFDATDVLELISTSKGVFQAWSNLQNQQHISPNDHWAKIIQQVEGERPSLNKAFFSESSNLGASSREIVQQIFQTFVLLTAENIFDDDSLYFLTSVGWTTDREWSARREGAALDHPESAQKVATGFANILSYWEEIDLDLKIEDFEQNVLPDIFLFGAEVRKIVSPLFRLNKIEIVDRYFVFAGELVGRTRDESPAWMDARFELFAKLTQLVSFASDYENQDRTRLWTAFLEGTERFAPRYGLRAAERPIPPG